MPGVELFGGRRKLGLGDGLLEPGAGRGSSTRRWAKILTAADLARSSASLLLSISNRLPAATDARKLSVDGVATGGA